MKKILALLLCIILICTLSVTVFASEATEEVPSTEIEKASDDIIDNIVAWVKNHLEELSVIATLLLTIFYNVRKFASMDKSIGTLNNNAITVANDSSSAIDTALVGLGNVSNIVGGYTAEFTDLKKTIKTYLDETMAQLETSKLANIELANEVAELLVLANIPNAKKEELYARHRAAVDAIATAGKNTEVIGNVEEA